MGSLVNMSIFFFKPPNSYLYRTIVIKKFSILTITTFCWLSTHNIAGLYSTARDSATSLVICWKVFMGFIVKLIPFLQFWAMYTYYLIPVIYVKKHTQFNSIIYTNQLSDDYHEPVLYTMFSPLLESVLLFEE